MFSFLKNISAKNRVWALMVLMLLACCALSFYLIYIDGIKDKYLIFSFFSLLLITFLSIILTRILISKFVKSINEDFFYISESILVRRVPFINIYFIRHFCIFLGIIVYFATGNSKK